MGRNPFSDDDYQKARDTLGVSQRTDVTKQAEERTRQTGRISEIVDPSINPIRRSMIRLDPHLKLWTVTMGTPMDIEVTCDTTGSMGGEVDTLMNTLPNLYGAVAKVLPGYDPQLCLGIFGDCGDPHVVWRPQFEMEAGKIVNYLKELSPQRQGQGNHGEDPQYAMFARAYLTWAYTNQIGLKGYHFVVTDEPYHDHLWRSKILRIFGDDIFNNELKWMKEIPSVTTMVEELKRQTHQFVLVLSDYYYSDTVDMWRDLCGKKSVIVIDSTSQLPVIVSAIVGLTEGTLDVTDLKEHLGGGGAELIAQLSNIEIGAQAKLRHALPHPIPKVGDIFANKGDLWPIQSGETLNKNDFMGLSDSIEYL